jgi:16S rRNA (guanine(527)-N(7))-methyltransferase RsmG
MSMDSSDALRMLLQESGMALESEAARRMSSYLTLLQKWNVRINLTSSTEWEVLGPMFREGIWAANRYPQGAISHLDIGSGAGFPALLLKIVHPNLHLELVESRLKKCQFLETAVHSLGLPDVQVHNTRLADWLRRHPQDASWDCVTWKAVRLSTEDLLRLSQHAKAHTQFWLFHGLALPWEESDAIRERFSLLRKEKIPGMREWNLSIYTTR